MDRYFDQIYYTLSVLILVAIAYSTYAGLRLHKLETESILKRRALGIVSAAIGIAIALLGGLFTDLLLKRSSSFQQTRFTFFFIGFTLVTFGVEAIARASQETCDLPNYFSQPKITSSAIWVLYLGTLAIAAFYLVNPNTFILNKNGDQIQLIVYWLPMLTSTLFGVIFLFMLAIKIREKGERVHLLWISAYLTLVLIGLLRESLIIRSLGNPLSDMLIAFVPFAAGSICLCFAVRSLLKNVARIL
jgi:hypothetical protein